MVRGLIGFGKLGEGFEVVGLIGVERMASHEVDDEGVDLGNVDIVESPKICKFGDMDNEPIVIADEEEC